MATTTNSNTINQKIWVAIDIAKYKHEVLIEYPNVTQKRLVIMNTLSDFNRLSEKLKDGGLPVSIGFEATGYYHRGLAYFLITQGFNVQLVSSIATARTRDAHYNSRDKNDKRDAYVIEVATLIRTNNLELFDRISVATSCRHRAFLD